MGVACSDQTGQTGGLCSRDVGSGVGSSMMTVLECITMATWDSIMIRSLKSTIIRSQWGIYYCYDQVFNLHTSKSANLNRAKRGHK